MLATISMIFVACEEEQISVVGISLDQTTLSLEIGETETLMATITPNDATNKDVRWHSSNSAVASVNNNGLVTALSAGTATITVTTNDGARRATCLVTVTARVTGVSLPTTLVLDLYETETLTATFTPVYATNTEVTWESSDTSVVTVIDGVITTVSVGTATVTVTTNDGGHTAVCNITVNQPKQITMTTARSGLVTIFAAGSGTFTIDWGDGSAVETHTLRSTNSSFWQIHNRTENFRYSHYYSDASPRTITVTSKNLTHFVCVGNEITSLDVSEAPVLIELICNNNQLTSLDVSANTALRNLNCSSNQLTSLDVSANTELRLLNCSFNQLTNLDVSANTALTFLNCSFNELTNLNVSGATALVELLCQRNQLTSLDVSNNTALTNLHFLFNQLTSLDVSANTALINLNLSFNQLTSLDVSKNTRLRTLSVFSNRFTALELNALFETLPSSTQTKSLSIGWNEGTNSSDHSIATAKGWTVYTTGYPI